MASSDVALMHCAVKCLVPNSVVVVVCAEEYGFVARMMMMMMTMTMTMMMRCLQWLDSESGSDSESEPDSGTESEPEYEGLYLRMCFVTGLGNSAAVMRVPILPWSRYEEAQWLRAVGRARWARWMGKRPVCMCVCVYVCIYIHI